ncbi:unnamed protein product [Urochloa decumbens]|uniref:glutathione transferase n=1 Tax=Urochloa decumbens TaxID=240449 RepID=A0ABC8XDF2_9POAL
MARENLELKLVGQWASAFVTRVKLALHLKGLSYESIEEDLRNKSELLLSSNPVHKAVPVLIHNADPYERAVARFWAAYIEEKLVAPWDRVFRVKTDEEREEAMKQMIAAAGVLEGGLKECSKRKCFFSGDSVGYVDVILGGAASYAMANEALFGAKLFDPIKTPLLAAWLEHFSELDAAKAVLQNVDRVVEHGKFLIAKNSARASNN